MQKSMNLRFIKRNLAAIAGGGGCCRVFLMATIIAGAPSLALGDEDVNAANNPLTPKITINFQDYYIPALRGVPGEPYANQFLFRGLIPWKLGDHGQLFRFTLPVATSPDIPGGHTTGLGDLTLMNITPVRGPGQLEFGFGPILVAPTASHDVLGLGRWQAGAVGLVIAPQSWGMLGGLVTYQHSFGDSNGRDDVSLLTFQPIVNYNLPNHYYLRSSGVWSFDLINQNSYIPVGLGIGKIWVLPGGNTINAFIEPQYTVWHDGIGTPKWQIYAGVNFQFALGGQR